MSWRILHLEVKALVLLDGECKSVAERVCLGGEILGAGLNEVDKGEGNSIDNVLDLAEDSGDGGGQPGERR